MWIEELFQNILHMSLIGSFVILLVLVARGLLRKVPKIYSYALWAVISVAACILLGIVLCANPKVEEVKLPTDSILEETISPADTSSEEPSYEAQIRDVTVWEKAVDYDGDATVDTISFVIQADDSYEKYGGVTDGQELLRAPFIGIVKCINGATKELSFASGNISHDSMGNYQISYTEIDGKHYMISTEIGEQMGSAYYCYEVYSLTEETLVDSYEIYFVTAGDDFRARPTDKYRQEVVPEFKEKLDKWIANAELIVATDVNERVEDGIFVSSLETTYEASYYYDLVWARMLDEKVRVDNYGPMVKLPDNADWIRNPQYLLSSYQVAHIKYFDNVVKAPLLLRYGQMEHMDLAYLHGMTFDRDLQTVWNVGEGENSVEILCQVSNEASQPEKKTVLVTWTYEDMNYVIFGELDKDADETTLAKTAIYVVENFENFHVPEDNKLIEED